jgi:RHS repeat-associated protein
LLDSTTLSNVTDSYGYNAFGEVTSYTASFSGTAIYSYTLTRDNSGRISEKSETINGVTTVYDYTYDSAGRLNVVNKNGSAWDSFTYDNNSNMIALSTVDGNSITATYDAQDRLTAWNSNTYTYNRNGELATKTVGSTTTTFTYDVLGGLTSVANGTNTYAYKMDGLHRRENKLTNAVLQKRYLYRDSHLLAELDSSGNIAKRFVYASKTNVPDYAIIGSNTYRLISDNLGSVRLVMDISAGTVAEQIDYNEFGKVENDTSPGFQPFGFAGGIYDSDTNLVRFGARDYDAEVGRWTNKDPILFKGGDTNLYGYGVQDPINHIDPKGTLTEGFFSGYLSPNGQANLGAGMSAMGAGLLTVGYYTGYAPTIYLGLGLGIEGGKNIEKGWDRGGEITIPYLDQFFKEIQDFKGSQTSPTSNNMCSR